MNNIKVTKVSFSEELPKESRIWISLLIEKILIDEITNHPEIKALLLSENSFLFKGETYNGKF